MLLICQELLPPQLASVVRTVDSVREQNLRIKVGEAMIASPCWEGIIISPVIAGDSCDCLQGERKLSVKTLVNCVYRTTHY